MEMKRFVKLSTLLPLIAGVIIGTVLFWLGDMDDSPGLGLIGLASAFCLIMWGIYNAGVIKKEYFSAILLLCFGAGIILVSIILLFDGEFENHPGIAFLPVALGIVMIIFGTVMIRKRRGNKH